MQRVISIKLSVINTTHHTATPKLSPLRSSLSKPLRLSPPPSFSTCLSPRPTMKPDHSRSLPLIRNRLSKMDSPPGPHTPGGHSDDGDPRSKGWMETASFRKWRLHYIAWVIKHHPIPCIFILSLCFFMGVEYTLRMVPPSSPPFDLGFVATRQLNRFLASRPSLNTVLGALNTVFVGMEVAYILWALVIEGRARPGIAAIFMFSCRGIMGYSTQLPLPKDYLGSGADFPVGNVSFFLFYSGHVASAVIASLDMRRMQRKELAWAFDLLNVLQIVRLLATRGHYTIDLAVGIGAGYLFDTLAGKYEENKAASLASYAPLEERITGGNV